MATSHQTSARCSEAIRALQCGGRLCNQKNQELETYMDINAYSPEIIIGASVVALVIMLVIAWAIARHRSRRRTEALRARFGSEYDMALKEYGTRRKAETALEARLHRVEG